MSTILFHCSSPVSVEAEWDETVLDALLRTGTPVPFFCRSGICGQCKSTLARGEVMQTGTAPQILKEDEVRAGMVLICRSVAMTDCEIVPQHLPVPENELPWPAQAEVHDSAWLTPKLFHFRVVAFPPGEDGDDEGTFLFHPGQYSYLQDTHHTDWDVPSRLYPATRPGHSWLDFFITAASPLQVRSIDEAFRVGAKVKLARPVGVSCLKEGDKGPVFIVANDEGLPAVLSMIDLLKVRDDLANVHVLVRGDASAPMEQRVSRACAESGIDVRIFGADELRSALDDAARAVKEAPPKHGQKPSAYVKGDEALVRLAREVLYARGLKPWDVHAEILVGAVPQL